MRDGFTVTYNNQYKTKVQIVPKNYTAKTVVNAKPYVSTSKVMIKVVNLSKSKIRIKSFRQECVSTSYLIAEIGFEFKDTWRAGCYCRNNIVYSRLV